MVKTAKSPQKEKVVSRIPAAHGVGRRKSCVARVWCYRGSGDVTVNNRDVNSYFHTHATRTAAVLALTVVPQVAKSYTIKVNVEGGGLCGQADAMKLGIARALLSIHEDLRATLRAEGLITVDPRKKERKKYGRKGARAGFQFVKR